MKWVIAVLLTCLAAAEPDESEAPNQEILEDESYADEGTDDESPEMDYELDENEDLEDTDGPGGGNPI